jgi:hypothetical protein
MQTQLTGIASVITEISENSLSLIDFTRCINEAVLCSRNNDVDHIREEAVKSVDGRIKVNVDPIVHRLPAKMHFPVEFHVISNIHLHNSRAFTHRYKTV